MEFVSWDDDIPNMMGKKSKCSKPPTSHTVDGCEILHQMKTVVNIPLFKGFQDFATIHGL
jgi:hypothetical protein